MSIFSRLFNAVKQKSVSIVTSGLRMAGFEDIFDAKNIAAFRESLYLFIGVSMIRDTVSSTDLELYQIKNTKGETEEIFDSPWLELFGRPNQSQTQREFWKLSVAYYLLAGEAFWYLEGGEDGGIPTAMVNMRPDFVEIITSQAGEIVGYRFNRSNGGLVDLPASNVLHIKNIDPVNPIRGIGVVRPATNRIVTEREASRYQGLTFKNQGRPDVAIFVDEDIDDEMATDARTRWDKVYGGTGGAKAGFFGSKVKDIKLLSSSPKEMDFTSSMTFLRDDILAALRIPKQMIDPDVNYSNSRVAYATYVRQACQPVIDTFLDVINNKMILDRDPLTLFFTYETELGEDREIILKEAVELKNNGIISTNEARDLMNYEAVEDGDAIITTQSPIQLALKSKRLKIKAISFIRKNTGVYRKLKAIEAVTRMIIAEKAVTRNRNSVFNTPELKEAYIKAFNDNIDRKAETFRETVELFNQGLYRRTMHNLETIGLTADSFMNVSNELQTAIKTFSPLMRSMFERVGNETMSSVERGFDRKASEAFYSSDDIMRLLDLRTEFFVTSMLNTDFEEMKAIIALGMSEGLGVEEIGRKLRKYFDDMSVSRARTIARTETGRLVSMATNEAYKQSAVVTGKEWLTAGDSKVRDEHKANSGVIVAVDGVFPSGEQFPGENSINCRCALAPAV